MPFSNFPLSPNINRPDLTDDNWNQHGFFDEIECEGLGYEFEGHRHCDDGGDYSASHSNIGHVYESDSQLFSGYFRDSVHDDYTITTMNSMSYITTELAHLALQIAHAMIQREFLITSMKVAPRRWQVHGFTHLIRRKV